MPTTLKSTTRSMRRVVPSAAVAAGRVVAVIITLVLLAITQMAAESYFDPQHRLDNAIQDGVAP